MERTALTMGPGMDLPIMHDSDRYELVRDIGSGNFGVARLMMDKQTGELVAVKYIERGEKVVSESCGLWNFFFLSLIYLLLLRNFSGTFGYLLVIVSLGVYGCEIEGRLWKINLGGDKLGKEDIPVM